MTATAKPVHLGLLELHRDDAERWTVRDHARAPNHARHVVARITQTESDDVEVVWLVRDIPLPTHYRDATDVIDDLARWRAHQPGSTRPIEIPHLRPFGG